MQNKLFPSKNVGSELYEKENLGAMLILTSHFRPKDVGLYSYEKK